MPVCISCAAGCICSACFYFKKREKSVSVLKGATFRHDLTLPLPPPGFLHTPDGGHPAPTPSRPSPAVFSAPWAGHWGGSAYPPGTHSHSAGKATMTYPKKDMHTPSTTNNAISLLPCSPFFLFFSFFLFCLQVFRSLSATRCKGPIFVLHIVFQHRSSSHVDLSPFIIMVV